jgi:hypothetical protein
MQHHRLGAIARDHRHALAARRAKPGRQPGGNAVRGAVQFGIGPAPPALQIGKRKRLRLGAGKAQDRIQIRLYDPLLCVDSSDGKLVSDTSYFA